MSTLLLAAASDDIAYLLRRYAEKSGFRTVNVSQGERVAPLAQRLKPVAIILETELPGATEREILDSLKENNTTRNIPVVLYTWLDQETDDQITGAVCYLHNPVLYEDFLTALESAGVCPHGFSPP